jgi:hypothetical protein
LPRGTTSARRCDSDKLGSIFVKLAEEVGLGFMKIVKLLQEWMNLFCARMDEFILCWVNSLGLVKMDRSFTLTPLKL